MKLRDDDLPPADLAALDAVLRSVRVEPRASLGPEIAGRVARGERARAVGHGGTLVRRLAGAGIALALVVTGLVRWGYAPPLDAFAATVTVDRCCADLDGGGKADDGVLVETVAKHRVRRIMVYEEQDTDRAWSPGESVRFLRRGAPAMRDVQTSDPLVTREFCCTDLDGGDDLDDGLLVMTSPTGDVFLAALFDRPGSSVHNLLR